MRITNTTTKQQDPGSEEALEQQFGKINNILTLLVQNQHDIMVQLLSAKTLTEEKEVTIITYNNNMENEDRRK